MIIQENQRTGERGSSKSKLSSREFTLWFLSNPACFRIQLSVDEFPEAETIHPKTLSALQDYSRTFSSVKLLSKAIEMASTASFL